MICQCTQDNVSILCFQIMCNVMVACHHLLLMVLNMLAGTIICLGRHIYLTPFYVMLEVIWFFAVAALQRELLNIFQLTDQGETIFVLTNFQFNRKKTSLLAFLWGVHWDWMIPFTKGQWCGEYFSVIILSCCRLYYMNFLLNLSNSVFKIHQFDVMPTLGLFCSHSDIQK